MQTEAARVADRNEKTTATIAAGKADRGFAVAVVGSGNAIHAVRGIRRGHGGYIHPRPLCQPNSPKYYAGLVNDQSIEITCKRCIASL